MKKHKLSTLNQGNIFVHAGHEFVVLKHFQEDSGGNGGTLCLLKNLLPKMVFSDCNSNDWRASKVRGFLNNWLTEVFTELSDVLPMLIDLKATNGSREYGWDISSVGLLTIGQYFKYNEYIPLADGYWWLASPYCTGIWIAGPDGDVYFGSTVNSDFTNPCISPRPTLAFRSDLAVYKAEGLPSDSNKDIDEIVDEGINSLVETIRSGLWDLYDTLKTTRGGS